MRSRPHRGSIQVWQWWGYAKQAAPSGQRRAGAITHSTGHLSGHLCRLLLSVVGAEECEDRLWAAHRAHTVSGVSDLPVAIAQDEHERSKCPRSAGESVHAGGDERA